MSDRMDYYWIETERAINIIMTLKVLDYNDGGIYQLGEKTNGL